MSPRAAPVKTGYFFFLWCRVLASSFLCLCLRIFFRLFLMTLLKKITSFAVLYFIIIRLNVNFSIMSG
jgi:hypothetical protein